MKLFLLALSLVTAHAQLGNTANTQPLPVSTLYTAQHAGPAVTFVSGFAANTPIAIAQNATPLGTLTPDAGGGVLFTETGGGAFDLEQPPPAATHSAVLTWTDGVNPPNTIYGVYRGSGACSAGMAMTKIATGVAALTYTDSSIASGTYCYAVTATAPGAGESAQSNQVPATIPSAAPTLVTVVVQ